MLAIRPDELVYEAERLVDSLADGQMSSTAYDTAWVARVRTAEEPQQPAFPAAVHWLLRHQHSDGSWGAEVAFPHDRLICTLAALVALAEITEPPAETEQAVRRALVYLHLRCPDVRDDPVDTVGFELLLPELLRQAREMGLRLPYEAWKHVEARRADKLSRIPPIAIYGGATSLTTSLEHQGERLIPLLIDRCQAPNGSVGGSPSATAYVLTKQWRPECARYLHQVTELASDGGIAFLHPFEIFETGWVFYYLDGIPVDQDLLHPHLEGLAARWTPTGVGWTGEWALSDSDDTSVVFMLLGAHGYQPDPRVLTLFEGAEHFHCFPFERDPSVGANAHILEALSATPTEFDRGPLLRKLTTYLRMARSEDGYWLDKWHASPFYATHQCARALSHHPGLLRPTLDWLIATQHEDGSWGLEGGNPEETALALASLMTVADRELKTDLPVRLAATRGGSYLSEHRHDGNRPALWRGKALYRPDNIVQAIILGTLYNYARRVERVEGKGA